MYRERTTESQQAGPTVSDTRAKKKRIKGDYLPITHRHYKLRQTGGATTLVSPLRPCTPFHSELAKREADEQGPHVLKEENKKLPRGGRGLKERINYETNFITGIQRRTDNQRPRNTT